ncbi:glucuronate isomerase [Heyndrickxia ginsengihumi]|uniref:glucuronate isomerase n=1 Tax=Heyndrickxia ginsengihumi TaxID=363870 RepID=UPI000471DC80|nr:glucuronate isomerase [Heyndrickxia ginsengihumi]MCM3024764.1 glucuronate isomerase [Heyndrickxia ginsengihumi]
MRKFLDENFLLHNQTAVQLFHDFAKDMPIIDYHCHLSPQEIYENKKFKNITEAWLYGDHYKWRLMRAYGIDEKYITGNADDYDKFLAWAKTVPMTIGNPLYQWTHLELQRYFGVYELLNEKTAPVIWEKVNTQLNKEGFGVRNLITESNVKVICTTDDPTDYLKFHELLKNDSTFNVSVLPGFRPDKGLEINREGFLDWVQKLASISQIEIRTYADFLQALESRVAFFHSLGGRVSDHAIDMVMFSETSEDEAAKIFKERLEGNTVSIEEETKYKTFTLTYLGKLYSKFGWVMQYHMNALRNNNTKMFQQLGPDTGYDSINDEKIAKPLVSLLDSLEQQNALPKTVLYSVNPNDHDIIAAITGSFQGGSTIGKLQLGTAWWFNDTKDGMLRQMKALANVGLFTTFIGMLTDSRSFLSYTRHEYFRRIVCNLLGEWVEAGEIPNEIEFLGEVVKNISYYNAKNYFSFDC